MAEPSDSQPPEGNPASSPDPGSRPPASRAKAPGRKQKGPFVDQCEAGKYAWCQCGSSTNYPYCDGTHRGSGITPLKVSFEKPCCVVWCACGESRNKPYCDGSHSRL